MYDENKLKGFVDLLNGKGVQIFFFVLIIMITKGFVIINEETIVALTFILFVQFAYTSVKDNLNQDFSDRRLKIIEELDSHWDTKIKSLEILLNICENQKNIFNQSLYFFEGIKVESKNILLSYKYNFNNYFYNLVLDRFNKLLNRQNTHRDFIQKLISNYSVTLESKKDKLNIGISWLWGVSSINNTQYINLEKKLLQIVISHTKLFNKITKDNLYGIIPQNQKIHLMLPNNLPQFINNRVNFSSINSKIKTNLINN